MIFNKEDLIDLGWEKKIGDVPVQIISDEMFEKSRWSLHYKRIFKYLDKYYVTYYSVGATESQDESPYEDEDDEIECEEVFPTEVKTVHYYTKKQLIKMGAI